MTKGTEITVGFVGLGAMGLGMACSLLRAGFTVQGYDINPDAVRRFQEAGGRGVESVADAARGAPLFIVMVVNAEQAEDVLFGTGQAASHLPPGAVVLLCSTVQPTFARQTAQRLAAMGLEMLDAPVSGGTARAAEGRLSIMASGPSSAFEKAAPVLDALAEHVYRMGDEPGQGSTMKLVNQILAGVHIAAAAEAMAFGARAGIDPHQIYQVICNSAGASFMFQNRMPHVLADDYTPHSAVDIWVKDLDLVLAAGKETRSPLFLSAVAHQLFMMAAAAGFGRLDDAAVIKVFEKIGDFRVLDAARSASTESETPTHTEKSTGAA
ncbi:NAD(P)-binding domain-containing protein [Litorilinea aerophila]|uniref:L-threonate dehydrogenase n=1 Tax=Litorilinea aerophila TaxID=1204385 RepID=A0A540VCK4_9CHLR|nr:L-threonate dehydrogenase [Litorilinea aerophila]MCC9077821.1 NAD(P)-binding domain-containing protein [Litorilinea aerophila]